MLLMKMHEKGCARPVRTEDKREKTPHKMIQNHHGCGSDYQHIPPDPMQASMDRVTISAEEPLKTEQEAAG